MLVAHCISFFPVDVCETWTVAGGRGLFFFLRLPYGQYGPVSQLSRSEESCTGPF